MKNWSSIGSVFFSTALLLVPFLFSERQQQFQTQESKEFSWTDIFTHFWNSGNALNISVMIYFIQYVNGNEEFQGLS